MANRLRSETGAGDIRRLLPVASVPHEHHLGAAEVAESLDDVHVRLDQLNALPDQTQYQPNWPDDSRNSLNPQY